MIMMRFKKLLFFKIASIFIGSCFFTNANIYPFPINRATLRPNLLTNGIKNRLDQMLPVIDAVQDEPTTTAILDGRVEPSFWLGGHDSSIYKSLNPKAELAVRRKEDIIEALKSLKNERGLSDQDVVLLYYHTNHRIRLVAAPLTEFLDERNIDLVIIDFAFDKLEMRGQKTPYIFEWTFEINPSPENKIYFEGVYINPSRRGHGYIKELNDYQRRILEQHFKGYEVIVKAAHINLVQYFAENYNGDLDFQEAKYFRSIYTLEGELYFLVKLGLITEVEASRLLINAEFNVHYVPRGELLYEVLRRKWLSLDTGNTLRGIIKRLKVMRSLHDSKEFDKLLFNYGGFSIRGMVGSESAAVEQKEFPFYFPDSEEINDVKQLIRGLIVNWIVKGRSMPSIFDFVIPLLSEDSEIRKAAEALWNLIKREQNFDYKDFFFGYELTVDQEKFLILLAKFPIPNDDSSSSRGLNLAPDTELKTAL